MDWLIQQQVSGWFFFYSSLVICEYWSLADCWLGCNTDICNESWSDMQEMSEENFSCHFRKHYYGRDF